MTRAEVAKIVKALVVRVKIGQVEKVGEDDHLYTDLGFDSLTLVELEMQLEQRFQISVSESESQGWTTVASVIDFVSKQR